MNPTRRLLLSTALAATAGCAQMRTTIVEFDMQGSASETPGRGLVPGVALALDPKKSLKAKALLFDLPDLSLTLWVSHRGMDCELVNKSLQPIEARFDAFQVAHLPTHPPRSPLVSFFAASDRAQLRGNSLERVPRSVQIEAGAKVQVVLVGQIGVGSPNNSPFNAKWDGHGNLLESGVGNSLWMWLPLRRLGRATPDSVLKIDLQATAAHTRVSYA